MSHALKQFLMAVILLGAALRPCEAQTETNKPSTERDAALPAARVEMEGWMAKHEALVQRAKQGNIDLYFLGDSITEAFPKAPAWRRYEKYKPGNFGIGGDRTQHVLYRIENGEFDGLKPKVVVLMIGTNNLSKYAPEDVARGITAIVKSIQAKSPTTKVLLLAIFPRGGPTEYRRVKMKAIHEIVSKLDDGKQVRYLDIGSKFLQSDGTISKEVMEDLVHPTDKGYEIWADAMQPLLNEMMK